MKNPPETSDLLSVARSVLKDELLEDIPAAKKYQALMVANAMAISARELEQGRIDQYSPDFLKNMRDLVDAKVTDEAVVPALIQHIRSNRIEVGSRQHIDLHSELLNETRRKLKISNPRYLELN